MKHLTKSDKARIAEMLREIADILNPQVPQVRNSGGGNGSGPPEDP